MHSRRALLAGLVGIAAPGCSTRGLRHGQAVEPPAAPDRCQPQRRVQAPYRSVVLKQAPKPWGWAFLSPDARTLLVGHYSDIAFVPLDGAPPRQFSMIGGSIGVDGADGCAVWTPDSSAVWLLTGDTMRPGGWRTGPVSFARRTLDGRLVPAPPLRGLPGRLDEVDWVDGSGVALATLNTSGESYRPQLPSEGPALAIVEAATGRVRDVVQVGSDVHERWGRGHRTASVRVRASALTRDGRVRALLHYILFGDAPRIDGLAVWTEGERLREFPFRPYGQSDRYAFTPGGERLLAGLRLSASGVIAERRPSPPSTPQTGPYAALYELSGKPLWVLEGTATSVHGGGGSAASVSADGRRGIVSLPESCETDLVYGVVDLRKGKVLSRLETFGTRALPADFNGNTPWLISGDRLQFYS